MTGLKIPLWRFRSASSSNEGAHRALAAMDDLSQASGRSLMVQLMQVEHAHGG